MMRDCVHYVSCSTVNAYAGFPRSFEVLCAEDSCPFYVPSDAEVGGMKIADLIQDALMLRNRTQKPFAVPELDPLATPF